MLRTCIVVCVLLCCWVLSGPLAFASIPEKIQKAVTLRESGDMAGARSLLQEVIEENPGHGPARLLIGQISFESCDLEEAEEHLKMAVVSNPRRIHLAWYLLGRTQLLLHRYSDARKSFSESLSSEPSFGPALLGRAKASLFLKDLELARIDSGEASRQQGTAWEARRLHAGIDLIDEKEQEAHRVLSEIVAEPQTPPGVLVSAQLMLESMERKGRYQELVSEYWQFADAYLAVGIRLLRMSRKEEGIKFLKISYEVDDQDPLSAYLLSQVAGENQWIPAQPLCRISGQLAEAQQFARDRRFEEAREDLEGILEDRPLHLPAQLIRLDILEQAGDYWNGLRYATEMADQFPEFAFVQARISALALKMRSLEIAECRAGKAVQLDSTNGALMVLHAAALKDLGKIDEAIKACEKAISFGYEMASAYVMLGNLYYEKMNISESVSALARAVEIDPGVVENIASFALTALATEDFRLLQKTLERHLENHPDNVTTLYALGAMYLRQDRVEDAKRCFLRLEELAPDQSQVSYNLGLIYLREGRTDLGKEAMERFRELKALEQREWARQNQAHRLRTLAAEATVRKDCAESVRLYLELAAENTLQLEDAVKLAHCYSALQDYPSAIEWYQKALAVFPYQKDAVKGLATAAREAGQRELSELFEDRFRLLSRACEWTER